MSSNFVDTSARRRRLCIAFAAGQLTNVAQAAALVPTAVSVQLPRTVDCEWESPGQAVAEFHRLEASCADGPLSAVSLLGGDSASETTPSHPRVRCVKDLTRLYVRGVHQQATELHLRELFAGCTDVRIPANNRRGNNGYAFVQFADSKTAAAHVNGKRPLLVLGKRLTVSFALERDATKLNSDQQQQLGVDGERFVPVRVDLKLASAGRVESARMAEECRVRRQRQEHGQQKRQRHQRAHSNKTEKAAPSNSEDRKTTLAKCSPADGVSSAVTSDETTKSASCDQKEKCQAMDSSDCFQDVPGRCTSGRHPQQADQLMTGMSVEDAPASSA